MGLVPIIAWAALTLWSPGMGLAVLLVLLCLVGWLAHLIRNFETAGTNVKFLNRQGAKNAKVRRGHL
jgi:hypothetical protein